MSIPQQPATPVASTPAPQVTETAPVDDRIRDLAGRFVAAVGETDGDSYDEPQAEPQQEAPVDEAPLEAQPEAETPIPEVPMVEVDVDGVKYQIPEQVKHRVMADKDYRQKTMEVAAERKALEQLKATATQIAQQAQHLAPYHAQLFNMDNRAQQLQAALQKPETAADPLEFNRVQSELAILLHQRDQFARGLQQQVSRLDYERQQMQAQQLALEAPKLFEEFPGLKDQATQQKLAQYVRDEGLPDEAIQYLNYSAKGTRLAFKAMQYDQMVAEQAKVKAKLAEKTKTLPAASQSSRAADPGAKDKQNRKEWQARGAKWNDPTWRPFGR